jgi:hypothetical protein
MLKAPKNKISICSMAPNGRAKSGRLVVAGLLEKGRPFRISPGQWRPDSAIAVFDSQ